MVQHKKNKMPITVTGPILTMEQAVRNYWSKLEQGGEAVAALFHPTGFFQCGEDKTVGREALAAMFSPDAEDSQLVVKSWSFNEAARTCTCEIETDGTSLCDVFQFDKNSFLIQSLRVYQ